MRRGWGWAGPDLDLSCLGCLNEIYGLDYDFFAEMSSLGCLVTDSDGCPASMVGLFFCNTNCEGLYLHMLYLLGLQLVKRVLKESL